MNKIEELEKTVADLEERVSRLERILALPEAQPVPERAFWDYQVNAGQGGLVYRCFNGHSHATPEEAKVCQETV